MGSSQLIVLDTHAWLWWLSNPEHLSKKADEAVAAAMAENILYLSAISAWEIAMLVKRGRLELTMEVTDWIAKSEALPFLHFVPVSNGIASKSVYLPGFFHDDPVDRIITATALTMGAALVTKDEKMRKYPYVDTIW